MLLQDKDAKVPLPASRYLRLHLYCYPLTLSWSFHSSSNVKDVGNASTQDYGHVRLCGSAMEHSTERPFSSVTLYLVNATHARSAAFCHCRDCML